MSRMNEPPPGDDPGIADASQLFNDDPPTRPVPAQGRPSGSPTGGSYDLEGGEPEVDEEPVRPPIAEPVYRPKPKPAAERPTPEKPTKEARVDQVWSRGAEWGSTLILLAIIGLILAFFVYSALSGGNYSLGFLMLAVGGAAMVALSYPIVITLERPVRVTPEQAVKDFYGALAHHYPHYRRMWLLLSTDGRTSMSFSSFPAFRNYWKARLAQLRGDRAGKSTPLAFSIDGFKSEKSAGKTSLDAKYTVNVFIRGRQDEPPIESIRVETSFVKGPDRMWYLNRGDLPGDRVI